MNQITPTWKEAESLIDKGFSVIPIKKDKRPNLKSWKEYQSKIIDKSLLFDLIDKSEGIALVCGFVSGNVEVIDVDTKYNAGFDATLFQDLRDFYPNIYKRLRIQKTPSGGYHIIYRCKGVIEGNQKLAGRLNDEGKQVNFIETRGEGGYICTFPTDGYVVINDVEVPVLNQSERDSIISLCRSYNTIIEAQKPKYEGSRQLESSYENNPFDDFNQRCDAVQLVEGFGYKFFQENSRFIQFTRPGKQSGVSLSFNRLTRCFFNFTASTELDENKGYNPATLLIKLQFSGDAKAANQWLVSNGYGKLKPNVEQSIIKRAVQKKKELPSNISDEGKVSFETLMAQINVSCPHGVFWFDTQKDGVQIDRERFRIIAEKLGFAHHDGECVKVKQNIIYSINERQFYDEMKAYIHCKDEDEYIDICIAFDKFCEKHLKWIISRLAFLDESKIIKDTRDVCYKHYQNGTLIITANDLEFTMSVDGLIFAKSIQNRDFIVPDGREMEMGKYVDFLDKAIGLSDYLQKFIGFLCHEYKDETIGYLSILTEVVPDPKLGGGSGKNVFCNLLKLTTTLTSKPADGIKLDNTLLQSWNKQNIFALSDAPEKFNYLFFREYATGEVDVKKLYKDEFTVNVNDMPRIIISSNYSVNINEPGLKRRVRFLEFTDFFTHAGGVDTHYGCMFPQGWSNHDWQSFDYFISQSIQKWLQAGCKLESKELSDTGWEKLFNQTYKSIAPFIEMNFDRWVKDGYISIADFKNNLNDYYLENSIQISRQTTSHKINQAIAEYSKRMGYKFKPNETKTIGKCKVWEKG